LGKKSITGTIGAIGWLISPQLNSILDNALNYIFINWFRIQYQPTAWRPPDVNWLLTGGFLGLSTGLLIGLLGGWLACWRHYVLRCLLLCERSFPWKLSRFLDEAAACILLHKTGGGYMFIHRLLLDYFADTNHLPD